MILLKPFPAALLRKEEERVLVVTDLHIGWEMALAEKGFFIPSRTDLMLNRILKLIRRHKPTALILLGDVKHTITKADLSEWRDIPAFLERVVQEVPNVKIIPGNHDGDLAPLLPENVEIARATGVNLWGKFGLLHGHTWPDPSLLECPTLITGHMQPMVVLRDASGFRITTPVWVRGKCNGTKLAMSIMKHLGIKVEDDVKSTIRKLYGVEIRTSSIVIMPSFNELIGGHPVNGHGPYRKSSKEPAGPILRSRCLDMEEAEVFMLDGTFLGTVGNLRGLA